MQVLRFFAAIVSSLLVASSAHAYQGDYLPLPATSLKKTFPIKYLGASTQQKPLTQVSFGLGTVSLSRPNELDVVLKGKDKNNLPWSITLNERVYAFYRADLDRNWVADGLLVYETMGNGLAPSSHLITLLFDKAGRPTLVEFEGYFDFDKKHIKDLLDLNGDKKAELVFMSFGSGYWRTDIYQAKDSQWQKLNGQLGKTSFPLFTRFTSKPNKKAVKLPANKQSFSPDLSNVTPVATGKLSAYQWADINQSEDPILKIKTQTKTLVCKPSAWNSSFSILIDTPKGRRIVSLTASATTVKKALDEIIKQGYTVRLFGKRDEKACTPELLWASPP
ncbi:hypothetical protein [Thiolinea disciformis]|uniref:hypothetical protein n=1 Tax=Thiolinea disciformis TaxID=125614 RepID=UPI000381F737|nr:hypothetical protein [Thiolinea disciformis]